MLLFSALIFDGKKQQLVTEVSSDREAFELLLQKRFGVYVCLWQSSPIQTVQENSEQ